MTLAATDSTATVAPFDIASLEALGIPDLPAERGALRRHLLDAIARIRPILEADAEDNDANETLSWSSVVALYREGLLSLKAPRELGGPDVDPLLYLELCDELSYINPSAGWCAFINSTSAALLGAFLPDTGVKRVFADDGMPIASGALIPRGVATPVDGGWRVSGRWPFASGSAHSSWLLAGFRIIRDDRPGPEHMVMAAPIAAVQFVDNWQVMGLKGTGSRDFALDDHFVPEDMAFDLITTDPRRGGPQFWLGRPGFVTPDHAAFALGVARRALDAIAAQAGSYNRGYLTSTIAQRGALQHDLGRCDQELRAARALCREAIEDAWEFLSARRAARSRASASPAWRLRVCHRCRVPGGYNGFPLRRGQRYLQRPCTPTLHARYQRGGPALHGQHQRVRQPRPVPSRPARRQPYGVAAGHRSSIFNPARWCDPCASPVSLPAPSATTRRRLKPPVIA